MRNLFFLSLSLLLLSSSLVVGQNYGYGGIKGEGEVVRGEFNLPTITGIELAICGDVQLIPGASQKVVIEAQQNIMDNIRREVNHGVWEITFVKGVRDAKTVKIYITLPTIEYIALTGSGNVTATAPFPHTNTLDLSLTGSGNVRMEGQAETTNMRLTGSGDVVMSGKTETLRIQITGSGNVSTKNLASTTCRIDISGSGDADVQCNGALEVEISGSGNVHYLGKPTVKANVIGSGDVEKL